MKILIAGIPEKTKNYEAALAALGIPYDTTVHPVLPAAYDRLLLPGGGDIHPSLFGQTDTASLNIDTDLDKAQLALLNTFVHLDRPVLGICKGLQIINVYFGGDIIQDLSTSRLHRYQNHDQLHPVRNTPRSVLHRLYGNSCTVNSAHHQGCGRIGKNLIITQHSPDGVIEALEHKTKPILGVQWHPERTGFAYYQPGVADGEKIISYFLQL